MEIVRGDFEHFFENLESARAHPGRNPMPIHSIPHSGSTSEPSSIRSHFSDHPSESAGPLTPSAHVVNGSSVALVRRGYVADDDDASSADERDGGRLEAMGEDSCEEDADVESSDSSSEDDSHDTADDLRSGSTTQAPQPSKSLDAAKKSRACVLQRVRLRPYQARQSAAAASSSSKTIGDPRSEKTRKQPPPKATLPPLTHSSLVNYGREVESMKTTSEAAPKRERSALEEAEERSKNLEEESAKRRKNTRSARQKYRDEKCEFQGKDRVRPADDHETDGAVAATGETKSWLSGFFRVV